MSYVRRGEKTMSFILYEQILWLCSNQEKDERNNDVIRLIMCC